MRVRSTLLDGKSGQGGAEFKGQDEIATCSKGNGNLPRATANFQYLAMGGSSASVMIVSMIGGGYPGRT
jgi:hypothetical protein